MRKSKAIYDLIQSLSTNEKRFYKIYASRHQIGGENNYVNLFNLFEGFKHYDEDLIQDKITRAKFVKYQAAEKNYLYQSIIECLDIYHKDSSVDRQITKYINIGRVLAEKKLEEQSVKVLSKAEQLASFHNRHESLITIYELQKRKDYSQDSIDTEKLRLYYSGIDGAIDKLSKAYYYHKIFDELTFLRRRIGYVISHEVEQKVKAFFPDAEKKDETRFSSFDEEVYYLLAKVEYYRLLPKGDTGLYYVNRIIKLFEADTKRITGEYIENYIYVLNVFIVTHLYKNEEEARFILNRLKNLEEYIGPLAKTIAVKAKIFEVYYTAISDLAIKKHDYHNFLKIMDEIQEGLNKYEQHMTPTFNLVFKSNIACIYFGAGLYKEALKWCHAVVNEAPKLREDAHYIMRILFLVLHYELGNYLILPSLIKSTYTFLGKRKRMYKFETIFIKYLRRLIKTRVRKENIKLFENFKEEILPLVDDPFENTVMRDVDVLAWVDEKIKKLKAL